MATKDHGPSIKDDETYEALRDEGRSKEAAARIANAGESASRKGGSQPPYEEWTVDRPAACRGAGRRGPLVDDEGRS
jgi:hypothetical protein